MERVLQTIQRMVAFYLTQNETKRYVHVLDKIVDSYNSRYHRMIDMPPNEAEKNSNRLKVNFALSKYYAKSIHRRKKPKYKIGTYVRAVKKGVFKRSFDEQYDVDFYLIHDIKRNLPFPMYVLRDPDGVLQDDLYYEEEIQPFTSDVWKIERVIKRRKRGRKSEALVKWLGFKNPEWIEDKNLSENISQ